MIEQSKSFNKAVSDGFIVNDLMLNSKEYDGNTDKFGITVGDANYIVKKEKEENSLDIYTEFVASSFIRNLGIECQETFLGYYDNEKVVIIKDFTSEGVYLHSFRDMKQSSVDTDISTKEYTYDDIIYLIEKHLKISNENKNGVLIRFWEMFICDSILGNRDRHWGNWGYLSTIDGYIEAPIYDNGASLFPNVNRVWQQYLDNEEEFLHKRVYVIPACLLKRKRDTGEYKRTNYYEMFNDTTWNSLFNETYHRIIDNYSCGDIFNLIVKTVESSSLIPKDLKIFYIKIVYMRYACILKRLDFSIAYENLKKEMINYEAC